MHIHKYEKIWLIFGASTLLIFLIILGIGAFYFGTQPPSCLVTIDHEKVDSTPPFNEPGLKQIGENEYQFTIVASAFNYDVGEKDKIVQIPKGATVHFQITTKDVVHGFNIAGTNVNMMVEPGYVSTLTETFNKAGTYTAICNEYCGVGHHLMHATVEVIE